jgi:ech hydrogenase subunit D
MTHVQMRDVKRTVTEIEPVSVVERAHHMKSAGYRMVEMHCTRLPDATEVNYAFDREGDFQVLRTRIPDGVTLPSVTGIYACAFLYENEMQDLFGVKVTDLAVDYKGKFYKLKTQTPYHPAACDACDDAATATGTGTAPAAAAKEG